jgi:hypothetical protein
MVCKYLVIRFPPVSVFVRGAAEGPRCGDKVISGHQDYANRLVLQYETSALEDKQGSAEPTASGRIKSRSDRRNS